MAGRWPAKNVHLNRLINIIPQLGFLLADEQLRFGVCEMNIIKVNYNWEKPRANISTAGTAERCDGAGEKTEESLTFFV